MVPDMHVACLLAQHRILLSLQPHLNFRIPAIPPVTPPNQELCSHCSYAQIFLPGCTSDRTSKQRIMLPLRPHSNSHPRRYPRGPRGGAAILGCRTQILGVPVCEIRERELDVLESRGRNHKLCRILHGNTHNAHSRTPTKEV